tara:strand:+ start:6690 stop:6959 length:270 start_codon:yes stop_codon:yes gene_type:complete
MCYETFLVDSDGQEWDIQFDFTYYPGRPAKLYALPEDCHPEEDEEYEISDLKVKALGVMLDFPESEISAELMDKLIDLAEDIRCSSIDY